MVERIKSTVNNNGEIYSLVVIIIGIALVISILSIAGLTFLSRTVPNSLENLSITSLAGLLGLIGQGGRRR